MLNRCTATELALDLPGGEVCRCSLEVGHEGEHACQHGFHFAEDKKLCLVHQMAKRLCGCEAPAELEKKPDVHRDFTELPLNQRVRFAGKLRTVDLCPSCNLKAVKVEDASPRRWPFKHADGVVEEKALRVSFIHDAMVGQTGYIAGAMCVVFERQKKKGKKK